MGLKSFLKENGFIQDDPKDKSVQSSSDSNASQATVTSSVPSFFPVTQVPVNTVPDVLASADPSFVTPLKNLNDQSAPDPAFIKFFEDELAKTNLPGPDYFEFRQLLIKTQQKMASKGIVAPEVVLQTVIMSFEAQDITPAKLIDAARHYKDILKQKNDDFLKGASSEKNNQLQKRQTVMQQHDGNIKKFQQQMPATGITKATTGRFA